MAKNSITVTVELEPEVKELINTKLRMLEIMAFDIADASHLDRVGVCLNTKRIDGETCEEYRERLREKAAFVKEISEGQQ